MKRLALSIVALGMLTVPAMADSDPCNIVDHPSGPTDNCIPTELYYAEVAESLGIDTIGTRPEDDKKTLWDHATQHHERLMETEATSDDNVGAIGGWNSEVRRALYPDRFEEVDDPDSNDPADKIWVSKKTMTGTIDGNTDTLTEHESDIGEWRKPLNDGKSVREQIEGNQDAIGDDWKDKNGDNTITDVIGGWTDGTDRAKNNTSVKTAIEHEETARINADNALSKRIDKNSEAIEDAIALSAAMPDSWLSDSENFALALGGGFTDGSSAFGGIGTFRISKNLSAYGGGSTLTDGGTWAAKGGVRLGW